MVAKRTHQHPPSTPAQRSVRQPRHPRWATSVSPAVQTNRTHAGQRPVLTRQRPRSETAVGDGGTKSKFRDAHLNVSASPRYEAPLRTSPHQSGFSFRGLGRFLLARAKESAPGLRHYLMPPPHVRRRGTHPGAPRTVRPTAGWCVNRPGGPQPPTVAPPHVRRRGKTPDMRVK